MNRRKRVRFNSDISVVVTCVDYPGSFWKGRLANLSAHGLSVILSLQLRPGSAVRVEWGSNVRWGRLVHCEPHGQEFLLGLHVEDAVYDTVKSSQNAKSLR